MTFKFDVYNKNNQDCRYFEVLPNKRPRKIKKDSDILYNLLKNSTFHTNWDFPDKAYEYVFSVLDKYEFDYKNCRLKQHVEGEHLEGKCREGFEFRMELFTTTICTTYFHLYLDGGVYDLNFSDLTADYLKGNYEFCEDYFISKIDEINDLDDIGFGPENKTGACSETTIDGLKKDYPYLNWEKIENLFIIKDIIE